MLTLCYNGEMERLFCDGDPGVRKQLTAVLSADFRVQCFTLNFLQTKRQILEIRRCARLGESEVFLIDS